MSELFSVNRINARLVNVMRKMAAISEALQNVSAEPSDTTAKELAVAIDMYSNASDAMLASIQTVFDFMNDESDHKVDGVRGENGIEL